MNRRQLARLDRELNEFLDEMFCGMGRPERVRAMRWYAHGQLLDGDRKSMEPMAARLVDDDAKVEGMRQRLQQCVCISPWNEKDLFRRVGVKLWRELPDLEAFVLDDTGLPKKGTHSVGVARQYSGTLGRTDNCQVVVSLHLAGEQGSGCTAMRLYLPESWASDRKRCRRAGVPDTVSYKPKWQIALDEIDEALSQGIRPAVTIADAGYGDTSDLRQGLSNRGLTYNVAIKSATVVWPPGVVPKLPRPKRGALGRPRTRPRAKTKPIAVEKLAIGLGRKAYRQVSWREGSRGKMSSRFAAVRIRTAHEHAHGKPPGQEQWLLAEWPMEQAEPTKFYLSTQPASCSLKELVRVAHLRWRVERDYQDLKQEVGLDHFEGRSWRGLHHHMAICAAAHAFLALRRALSPPKQQRPLDPSPRATSSAAGAAASPG